MDKLKILFLEDDDNDMVIMKRELKIAEILYVFKQVVSRKEFVEALTSFNPDIIIADYSLPAFNGMHAFRIFKDKQINIPFLLVTGFLEEDIATEFLDEGVDDILLKNNYYRLPSKIIRCLKSKKTEVEMEKLRKELEVNRSELHLLHEQTKKQELHTQLSNREYEIFCLIGEGKSVKEIADHLYISPSTVATYRSRIMEKMNLKSNVEITRYAILNKLIG